MPDIPSWTDGASDWNTAMLGEHILAGIWDVEGLKCGIDVDTKKAKGADGPTSSDNGVDAAKFKLKGHLNSVHFAEFQAQFPDLNPRRPGRERQPVPIIHPKTMLLGIRNVRIVSFEIESVSAKDGLRCFFEIHEWFDKPKATKKKEAVKQSTAAPAQQLISSNHRGPDGELLGDSVIDYVKRRQDRGEPEPDTSSVDAIMGNLFAAGGQPPP
jgi:hypothetical protein